MEIQIEVTGGTDKTVRSNMQINGEPAGELQIARAEFTRFCDLLFNKSYTIVGNVPEKKI